MTTLKLKKIIQEQIELKKYGIKELKDNLTIEILKKEFPWIFKATLQNATIGTWGNLLVWYDGIWKNGQWEDGTWFDGIWENGTWLNGMWYDGLWKNGIWKKGTWVTGKIKDKKSNEHP